jgi:hypothetical protein
LPVARYPADELEQHVVSCIDAFLANPQKVVAAVIDPSDDARFADQTITNHQYRRNHTHTSGSWQDIVRGVRIERRALSIRLCRQRLRLRLGLPTSATDTQATIDLHHPLRLFRTAHELRLIVPSDSAADEAAKTDDSLVRFIARGRRWYRQITSGEMPSIQAIAKAEGVTERYVARVLRGSLISPTAMQAIFDGRQNIGTTVRSFLNAGSLCWSG